MNSYLLYRSLGEIGHHELRHFQLRRQIFNIQASDTRFSGNNSSKQASRPSDGSQEFMNEHVIAHNGGVNAITIDPFEGRYLLSGGANSIISIWDLEKSQGGLHEPLGTVLRDAGHKFGITDISFYPFDSLAFLSTSYDYTLKLFSSETLTASASFDLNSVVYSHAVSPIAAHLLVACATQHPVVRLVDLRTGAAAQALAGHAGAVLTVGWSPIDEHVLASGGTDGTIRFWDIRRSAGQLGLLDLEDSVGILGYNGAGGGARPVSRGKAHMGPVNGLVWADDGRHLVSTGHDEKIRVWNTIQGSNTLANFGPLVKNRNLSRQLPCLVPSNFVGSGEDVLFFPSEKEILMYQLFEGKLLKRFRNPESSQNIDAGASTKTTSLKNRVVDLAWRPHSVELYSGHGNGTIRAWKPRLPEDIEADDEEREQEIAEENERKRKRQVLEDVFQDLTRKKMIFS